MSKPNFFSLSFKEANQYLIWIFAIGIALGFANYALGIWSNLFQSIILQVSISLVIGYLLLVISFNHQNWLSSESSEAKKYILLLLFFITIGFIGSEIQLLINGIFFQNTSYQIFSGEGTYLFNAILTSILGFTVHYWTSLKQQTNNKAEVEHEDIAESPKAIPIRKGETVTLYPTDSIIYFEAYDNYSLLYDLKSSKNLCNYPLIFLTKKLDDNFVRVHRKYLINKDQIHQIKPHLKGRYVIEFKDKNRTSIISSTSYSEVVKAMTKL